MTENQPKIGTLARWVGERSLPWPPGKNILKEWNARRVIAMDIARDRILPISPSGVKRRTAGLMRALSNKMGENKQLIKGREDTITGEPYDVILEHTDGWSIREQRPDGTVFSRAFIGDDGSTRLTLDFTGDRFQRINANPGIQKSTKYPTATVKVFTLLAKPFLEVNNSDTISAQR